VNAITLAVGGVLLLGIICASVYGAKILPAGAQLPLHFGPAGYTRWAPKNIGLLMWPAIGVAVYVLLVVQARSHHATGGHGLPLPAGLTLVLALMLVSHVGAVRVAVSRGGQS